MNTKPTVDPSWVALGLVLAFAPSAFAQTLSPDFAKAAQDACVGLAASKGFTLTKVVSVEPKGSSEEATVVLNLDRAGEPYKLTCGYTTAGGVTTSADQAANQMASNPVMQTVSNLVTQVTSNFKTQTEPNPAPTTPETAAQTAPAPNPAPAAPNPAAQTAPNPAPAAPNPVVQAIPNPATALPSLDPPLDPSAAFVTNTASDSPNSIATHSIPNLWWLLLPLIGMPLLLFWLSKRGAGRDNSGIADTDQREAIVRSNDPFIKIYSHPNEPDNVIGTLQDGEHVILSGRQKDGWAELELGGWVPTQYLDLNAQYSVR